MMSAIAWGTYELEGVMPGDYVLRVIGKNCVDHDYAVTVSGDTVLDVKICPIGAFNLTRGVTSADANAVYKHVLGSVKVTDPYALLCGDVVGNGNGLTSADSNAIFKHVLGTKKIWTPLDTQ